MDSIVETLVVVVICLVAVVVGVHFLPAAVALLASTLLQVLPLVVVVWFVFAVLKAMVSQILG